MGTTIKKELSIKDTNVLKGIALLILLFHHLWYTNEGADLNGNNIIDGTEHYLQTLSISCKICVAIFVFLSGYGLTKSYKGNAKYHFAHRLTKLYLNYWLIWILFVPVGVFYFNRTFPDVYQTSHVVLMAIIDFLGLSTSFGFYGYNATWWFYSSIILLYIIYPLIHRTIKYWHLWFLVGISFSYVLGQFSSHISVLNRIWTFVEPIHYYLGVFIWGCLISQFNIISWLRQHLNTKISIALWGLFVYIAYFRIRAGWGGMNMDPYLTVLFVLVYTTIGGMEKTKNVFAFIGKHSFNIFLFHTFIFALYFHNFVYYTQNPVIQYLSLLIPCIIISVLIEKLKQIIHFDFLSKWIENIICKI